MRKTVRSHAAATAALLLLVVLPPSSQAAATGDVTVTKKGKTITIAGGADDDSVSITTDGSQFFVTGLNGTTVGGQAEAVIEPTSKTRIVVALGDGTNEFRVTASLSKFSSLTIQGGEGADTIVFTDVTVPAAVTVNTGNVRPNTFSADGTRFDGKLTFTGGDANDIFSAANCTFRLGAAVTLGADGSQGIQTCSLTGCTISGPVSVTGGPESDELTISGGKCAKQATVDGGAGTDLLTIGGNAEFSSTLKVRGKDGDDHVVVGGGPDFKKAVTIDAGPGSDDIEMNDGGFYDKLTILGGQGDDLITLSIITVLLDLNVNAGPDTDTVQPGMVAPDLRGEVVLDGSTGDDTLLGSSRIPKPAGHKKTIKGFETEVQ